MKSLHTNFCKYCNLLKRIKKIHKIEKFQLKLHTTGQEPDSQCNYMGGKFTHKTRRGDGPPCPPIEASC